MHPRIPTATYRLQFNRNFTLKHALELVPYFHALGISDLYCSPLLKAVTGSTHGYDVVDCTQLNPELGSEDDLSRLSDALQKLKMGLILDIVPNHMSLSEKNQWLQDVLENGPSSFYANFFNIIWTPCDSKIKNKILLPFLEHPFEKELQQHAFKIVFEDESFFIQYKCEKFPLNPSSWPIVLRPFADKFDNEVLQEILKDLVQLPRMDETEGENPLIRKRNSQHIKKRLSSLLQDHPQLNKELQRHLLCLSQQNGDRDNISLLGNLLDEQAYLLNEWTSSHHTINYFCFFDIVRLITMRTENPSVFEAMHALVLQYVRQGWITGFRVDHIDGLYDPESYLICLQKSCAKALELRDKADHRNFFIVVEKILGANERLRMQWPCFGTTGYDFLVQLNTLYVVDEFKERFLRIFDHYVDHNRKFEDEIYASKKFVLNGSLASSIKLLACELKDIYNQEEAQFYTLDEISFALKEIIACYPVYRSYVRPDAVCVDKEDREIIMGSVAEAKRRNQERESLIFDDLRALLLLEGPPALKKERIEKRRIFVMRFQQMTGPAAAKGVEDTALYRIFPLTSLNEVGMDPQTFGIHHERFHLLNQERLMKWPYAFSATSTHDNKRSQDVRARLNVLSEDPNGWMRALENWTLMNLPYKTTIGDREIPDRTEEYFLYQTLIGSWPLQSMSPCDHAKYVDRIVDYMIKALREAKENSSWEMRQPVEEVGMSHFVRAILKPDATHAFLNDFEKFIHPVKQAGLFNSLSQVLLKITSPGIPDFYQGNECWDFSLVDPDNRHAIDFQSRVLCLASLLSREDPFELMQEMLKTMEDGRIKLYMTAKLLNVRKKHASLFQEGEYIPLKYSEEQDDRLVAFCRKKKEQALIVISGRFFLHSFTNTPEAVRNAPHLLIPPQLAGTYQDVFSGLTCSSTDEFLLPVPNFFSSFPMLCLERVHGNLFI